jgi:hypothetical protein
MEKGHGYIREPKKMPPSAWCLGAVCAYLLELNYDDLRFVLSEVMRLMYKKRKATK